MPEKKSITRILAAMMLPAVCAVCSCTVEKGDEYYDDVRYETLNGTYATTGVLIGDIDAVAGSRDGQRDTTRYADVKTYMHRDYMAVENFPTREILAYIPGAEVTGELPAVSVGYVREKLPGDFNAASDSLRMEIKPDAWEFDVLIGGGRHAVKAEFDGTDGWITYGQLIQWKYSFRLRVSALWLDGEPAGIYADLPETGKIDFICNAWIMTYGIF